MKPILQSVIRHTGLSNRNNTNETEIDFICFSISSHSLSGTPCHLLFSGQALGSITKSDTVQSKVYSTADMLKNSEQSFSD